MTSYESLTLSPIVSLLSDDPDMHPLVHMFVEDAPEKSVFLATAAAAADWQKIKQLAHQLKGSAAGYGFPALTEAAGDLERLLDVPEPNQQHVTSGVTTVLDMLRRLRAA
jgi:histidine phosphotransfer protein HptB